MQVFGGTKLIVPPHWKIETEEVVAVFGGLNDKRQVMQNVVFLLYCVSIIVPFMPQITPQLKPPAMAKRRAKDVGR